MGRTKRKRQKRTQELSHSLDHELELISLRKFMSRNDFKDEINLKLRNFPQTGRGLATNKPLHPNSVIIKIPYSLMITYTTLKTTNFQQLFNPDTKLPMQVLLAAFLVLERHKKDSFWSDYIKSLPSEPPFLPALLPKYQISLLPEDVKLAVKKSRQTFKESWSRLKQSISRSWRCSCCGRGADCVIDLHNFTWGYIMVNTRAVYVDPVHVLRLCERDVVADTPDMALCPYLDMFNHSPEAKTSAGLVCEGGRWFYQLVGLTETKKFRQVFISYGPHGNVRLLVDYGFFVPDGSSELVPVSVGDLWTLFRSEMGQEEYKFVRKHGLEGDLYVGRSGPSFNLKAYLFVAVFGARCRDYAAVVYGDRYPVEFLKEAENYCKKVLDYLLGLLDCLLNREGVIENFPQVVVHFLKYRRDFVKELCDNDIGNFENW